jgi:hypothetical protein
MIEDGCRRQGVVCGRFFCPDATRPDNQSQLADDMGRMFMHYVLLGGDLQRYALRDATLLRSMGRHALAPSSHAIFIKLQCEKQIGIRNHSTVVIVWDQSQHQAHDEGQRP